jgi:hypothetical protein
LHTPASRDKQYSTIIQKRGNMHMFETCNTPDDAWGLVTHNLGGAMMLMHLALEGKEPGWETAIGERQREVTPMLRTLADRMRINGHDEDQRKIESLAQMMEAADLTTDNALATLETIEQQHREYNPRVQAMEAAVKKFFGEPQ